MYVVGTAGHVDHGKSTLVHALTGIDPDRLQEEKDRGMTIDLGFAWLKLPSGREVSIVDVPGHERFIKNMLAGVGGIDLALLVIAADEGIMPQTEEHLSILELLRVKRAVVALTKKDLVEPDWLELVEEDVANRIARSRLAGAPIVVVSAVTGEGLPELLRTLDRALDETPLREDLGRPRLPIDRVFSIAGFGTVATGTLVGGKLQLGQELEIQPGGIRTRARGLQTHRKKADVALPGSRVAVNLAGLATTDLYRGQVATTPGWLQPTSALDASLQVLASARPLAHNASVTFHTGAAEAVAKVIVLEGDQIPPGATGWVQIRLGSPVAVAKGDLFVLRSSEETVGGGEVVEPHARRHRRRQASVVEGLALLQRGTPEELVFQAIERDPRGLSDLAGIAQRSGLAVDQAQKTVADLAASGRLLTIGDTYATPSSWGRLVEKLVDALGQYHRQYPLRTGMPREELKGRAGLPTRLYNLVLERLAAEGRIGLGETTARLAEHVPALDPQQASKVDRLLAELRRDPYSPPSLPDISRDLGVDGEIVGYLLERRRIVRLNDSVAYLADAYDEMVARVVETIRAKGEISVGEVRDLFGTSRKYALALAEHLDEQRITRRVGDARVLR